MDAFTPALISVLSLRLDIPVLAAEDPAIEDTALCAVLDFPRLGEMTLSLMSSEGLSGLYGYVADTTSVLDRRPLPVNEGLSLSLALAQVRPLEGEKAYADRVELTFHYDLETTGVMPEMAVPA